MGSHSITNIIFTKDRPLQLHAYLKSLFDHFPAAAMRLIIIYKENLFDDEYQQVFAEFPNCEVKRERDFFDDTWAAINEADTPYLMFGIDDVVFFDTVDLDRIYRCFESYPDEIFGFSLRLRSPSNAAGSPYQIHTVGGETLYSVDWTRGDTDAAKYPFELCATLYPTDLVRRLLFERTSSRGWARAWLHPSSRLIRAYSRIKSPRSLLKTLGFFYNPNTLESWNCRWCRNHPERFPNRLFFEKPCAAALQVNLVNTATPNEISSEQLFDVHELNRLFRDGYRLNIESVRNDPPTSTHGGRECFHLTLHS